MASVVQIRGGKSSDTEYECAEVLLGDDDDDDDNDNVTTHTERSQSLAR